MPFSGVQTCALDRKSTRLNSSHTIISYAVFCLKKKNEQTEDQPAAEHRGTLSDAARKALESGDLAVAQRDHARLCVFFFKDPAPPRVLPFSPPPPSPV